MQSKVTVMNPMGTPPIKHGSQRMPEATPRRGAIMLSSESIPFDYLKMGLVKALNLSVAEKIAPLGMQRSERAMQSCDLQLLIELLRKHRVEQFWGWELTHSSSLSWG